MATCGDKFKYLNGTTWDTVSGVNIVITTGQNNQFVWTTAIDEIFGTNDTDTPIRYDGTNIDIINFSGLSAASTPSSAKTISFFKNFLILGNTVENTITRATRIRWSDVGTTDSWSDENFIDISALGGQELNAAAELYDNLYLFFTDSIYRLTFVAGADTFNVSKVTDDIGAIAKNSVQNITLNNAQNGLIFLDKDKRIYFFNGIVAQDISTLIETTMDGLSEARLQYAVSTDTDTDYWLCVTNGSSGLNDLCLDFQYELGEWTKHTNINANAMARVLDNNAKPQTFWGSYESFVYQLEDTSLDDDVGSASGTVEAVSFFSTTTASAQHVIYDSSLNLTTGNLAGAPILLTSGTASGLTNTLSDNTATGLVMTDDFSTTPDTTTTYEVGAIDSFYTSKWYDFGFSGRRKNFKKVYFWAEADSASTIDVSYASDLSADVATRSLSLSSDSGDAIWGTDKWGVGIWGSQSDVFREANVTETGRYFRVMFDEDDPGETFYLYGWLPVFQWSDID